MKISFANTLADICNQIPGADVDSITQALGADKRISPYYIKGGVSYGGPCFPRDNRAFSTFAANYGINAHMAKATDVTNRQHIDHLIDLVIKHLPEDKTVAILGIAYKPDTPVIEESASIKLIEKLLKKGVKVIVFDPLAKDNTKLVFGDKIHCAASIKDCFTRASLCVITGQHKEFKFITEDLIANKHTTIIDCWRLLKGIQFGDKVKYIAYGTHP